MEYRAGRNVHHVNALSRNLEGIKEIVMEMRVSIVCLREWIDL